LCKKRASDDETARAMAILEGKSAPAKPAASKVTMQVAALASQEKVDELQAKLRSAGVSSYTESVDQSGRQNPCEVIIFLAGRSRQGEGKIVRPGSECHCDT
jgi:DedD protein